MPLLTDALTIPPAGTLNGTGVSAAKRQLAAAAERAVVPLVYGEDRISGLILNVLSAAGTPGTLLVQVLWCHACTSINDLRLNDAVLPIGASATHYTGTQTGTDATLAAAFTAQGLSGLLPLTGFAYSVVAMPAALFDGQINLTARIRGRKVYDPSYDSTAGGVGSQRLADPSTWAWSDVPAACLADFLANATYGAGVAVDWASVRTTSLANRTIVPGTLSEQRRVLGVSFTAPASTADIAETLRAYAGCFLLPGASGVRLVPDQDASAVASYRHAYGEIANIGALELRDLSQAPTAVEVIYTDTSAIPWRDASAIAQLSGAGTTKPWRLSQVRLPGIQRYGQALREANERLNKLWVNDIATTLEVFDTGIRHDVGDIVTVDHPLGLSSTAMRITDVGMSAPGRWQLGLVRHSASAYSDAVASAAAVQDAQRIVQAPARLGIKLNFDSFSGSINYNEAYLHAVDAAGNALDAPGYITVNGVPAAVPNGPLFTNLGPASGYIVWDSAGATFSTVPGMRPYVFARRYQGAWQYDDNSTGWVAFTPAATHWVIGALESGAADTGNPGTPPGLTRASLYAAAVAPSQVGWDEIAGRPSDDAIRNNIIDLSWWRQDASIPWSLNYEYNRLVNTSPSGGADLALPGPKGGNDCVWYTKEVTGDGENGGGWNGPALALNPTQTYRFVIPIRRMSGAASAYWGTYNVCDINTTTPNGNPYFAASGALSTDRWYLFVGYIYPAGSTGNSSDSAGIWDCRTGAKVADGNNWTFKAGDGSVGQRAYQYYASAGAEQVFGRPMVNLVDGTEPSLREFFEAGAVLNSALVPSITAAQTAADNAQSTASTAAGNASSALSTLATMRSNGYIDAAEKPALIKQWLAIRDEQAGIYAQGSAYGLTTLRDAYLSAYQALVTYLGSLSPTWDNTAYDTPITPATDQATWSAYYSARQTLLNAIADEAAKRAQWSGVSGSGKPLDNAGRTVDLGAATGVFGARDRDDAPGEYPYGRSQQFKQASAIGLSAGDGTYCTLETIIQYTDDTGGPNVQYAYQGSKTWRRYALRSAASWGAWTQDLDRNAYTGSLDATRNSVTYASTAPSSPADGDIWVDLSTNPARIKLRVAGNWQSGATLTTNTNQLTDGAGLGNTAVWAQVSGAGRPADNATKNAVTYSTSAPSSPTDGDLWVDTSVSPRVWRVRLGGAWQPAASYVLSTSDIADGAQLGLTAIWTGVTGTGKPDDYATRNPVYFQDTDPGSVPNGSIWISSTKAWQRVSGAWQPYVGNGSIDTTQLANAAATVVSIVTLTAISFSNIS